MKRWMSAILMMAIVTFTACNSGKKVEENATYTYEEPSTELNEVLKAKIGDWAKEGVECYGIIVAIDQNGIPQNGFPIKAKIIRIKSDKIKMKALEAVNIGPKEGCSKMGMSYGETWWEEEGDLFQTLEEAEAYLKKQGLL